MLECCAVSCDLFVRGQCDSLTVKIWVYAIAALTAGLGAWLLASSSEEDLVRKNAGYGLLGFGVVIAALMTLYILWRRQRKSMKKENGSVLNMRGCIAAEEYSCVNQMLLEAGVPCGGGVLIE
jgi:hypothetical protein